MSLKRSVTASLEFLLGKRYFITNPSPTPSSCSLYIGHVIPYNTCSYTSSPPILIYPLAVFPLIPLLSRGCEYWVSCVSQSLWKISVDCLSSCMILCSRVSPLAVSICVCCSSQIDWLLKGYSPLAGNDVLQYCIMQCYYQFMFMFWSPFWCQWVSFYETSLWVHCTLLNYK